MENRNQYNSPRERIDDALLIRLLSEEAELPEYTCTGERRNTGNSCGCTRNTKRNPRERAGDCGCGNPRERAGDCGCGNPRERAGDCGCGNPRDRAGDCGCDNPRERAGDCGCGESCARNSLPGFALAMVYMPDHDWDDIFCEEEALMHGTLFRPLDFPFYPGKCGGSCGCR